MVCCHGLQMTGKGPGCKHKKARNTLRVTGLVISMNLFLLLASHGAFPGADFALGRTGEKFIGN
jgi:hypothetical protein